MSNNDYNKMIESMQNIVIAKELDWLLSIIEWEFHNEKITKEEYEKRTKEINEEIDRLTGRNDSTLPKISLYELDKKRFS